MFHGLNTRTIQGMYAILSLLVHRETELTRRRERWLRIMALILAPPEVVRKPALASRLSAGGRSFFSWAVLARIMGIAAGLVNALIFTTSRSDAAALQEVWCAVRILLGGSLGAVRSSHSTAGVQLRVAPGRHQVGVSPILDPYDEPITVNIIG
jgi:hypothetical protein